MVRRPVDVNGWRLCATQKLDDVLHEVDVAVAKRAIVAVVLGLVAVLIVLPQASHVALILLI